MPRKRENGMAKVGQGSLSEHLLTFGRLDSGKR